MSVLNCKSSAPFFLSLMMIPQWLRSPSRVNTTPRSPSHFSSSSFKDINAILKEEEASYSYPQSHKSPSIFHRVKLSTSVLRPWASRHAPTPSLPSLTFPGAEKLVTVYLTSLHVVRRTYEDCKAVRSILRGFRVLVDERDLSLDPNYLDELQGIIGRKKSFNLPLVFVGGKHLGGADEIKRLHECGELKKMIDRLPLAVGSSGVCSFCQGMRFVVCYQCNGSHKIYSEKYGFRSCTDCNDNGLIRCPSCSSSHRPDTYTCSYLKEGKKN